MRWFVKAPQGLRFLLDPAKRTKGAKAWTPANLRAVEDHPLVDDPSRLKPSPPWRRVDAPADAAALLDHFGGFHDALLHELQFCSGAYMDESAAVSRTLSHLRAVFQGRTDASGGASGPTVTAIETFFYGVVRVHLGPHLTSPFDVIDSADIQVLPQTLGSIGTGWPPPAQILWTTGRGTEEYCSWIESRLLLWRPAPDWLGPRLRYLDPDLDLEIADPLRFYLHET